MPLSDEDRNHIIELAFTVTNSDADAFRTKDYSNLLDGHLFPQFVRSHVTDTGHEPCMAIMEVVRVVEKGRDEHCYVPSEIAAMLLAKLLPESHPIHKR